jgi:hypothetical protein
MQFRGWSQREQDSAFEKNRLYDVASSVNVWHELVKKVVYGRCRVVFLISTAVRMATPTICLGKETSNT